jgi:uncharacterized protein YndB with AHSA1/START domain
VFSYLTDPLRYLNWIASQATFDPVPGGVYHIHIADGFQAAGTFIEVLPPHRVSFTWGFADNESAPHVKHEPVAARSSGAMPAGSTRVTVTLDAYDGGTRVTLQHKDLPSAELRDAHQIAWETYRPRLAIRATGGEPGPDPHA